MDNQNGNEINEINESNQIIDLDTENKDIKKLKKKNTILTVFVVIFAFFTLLFILLVIAAILYFNGSMIKWYNMYKKVSTNIATESEINSKYLDSKKISKKVEYIDSILKAFYYYPINDEKVEQSLFEGMIRGINDKYADYFHPQKLETFIENTEGEYFGIGVSIGTNEITKDHVVLEVMDGSPAKKAGILPGDVFYSIDGELIDGMSADTLVSKIKGVEGKKVKLQMYRNSTNKLHDFDITVGRVETKTIKDSMLDNEIGYMSISQFEGVTSNQFSDAVESLQNKGMKKLIIDLRGNPGGNLDIVLDMLDYILPDKNGKYTNNTDDFESGKTLLTYMKDRVSITDVYYCSDNHSCDFPVLILTDEGSASASELFSQTMRDYAYGFTVGEKTYGKGVVQSLFPIDDGSAVKFTIGEYFTPSGYAVQGKGVIPNYLVDYEGNIFTYNDKGEKEIKSKYEVPKEVMDVIYPEKDYEEYINTKDVVLDENSDVISLEDVYFDEDIATPSIASKSDALNIIENIITNNIASQSEIKKTNKIASKSNANSKFEDMQIDEKRQFENAYFYESYLIDEKDASMIDYQLCKAYEIFKNQKLNYDKNIKQ